MRACQQVSRRLDASRAELYGGLGRNQSGCGRGSCGVCDHRRRNVFKSGGARRVRLDKVTKDTSKVCIGPHHEGGVNMQIARA